MSPDQCYESLEQKGRIVHNILIVEDNADIADLVALHLRDLQCQVMVAENGTDALQLIENNHYDLVLLDLMLPGADGHSVCRYLRQRSGYTPVIMLTSKSSELDRVVGLEIGADDYVTKPFSVPELMARVKAQLRRNQALKESVSLPEQEIIRFGVLCMDPGRRQVTIRGDDVELTAREFELLHFFIRHPGRVFSRMQLLEHVWGYGYEGYEHTVNSHINRLRNKIEQDPANPDFILTVWGVGYRCCEIPPNVAHAV